MTRGERVIAFIQKFCLVPEGTLLGNPVTLLDFQKKFILAVYDNPVGTSRAYLSIARKNGKTGLIACLLLAHIVGPEAYQNGRIVSGARSRKQAAEVFNYASKMIMMSPELSKLARIVPSAKMIVGLAKNVEYQASSAEAKSAHGGSPILAILDEVGQIKGPTDDFVEAIETSQGAYEGRAMLFAISTQAATDNDLFTADKQALSIAGLTKALRELNEIGVAPLTDVEKVEEAYRNARRNATDKIGREEADRARQDALRRLEDQNPTVTNSDGHTTNVPIPGQKPVTLGDKPDAETKKAETAAQRAANAYRDLKKSADDRIAQMQMETALLGKFGIEADAARFSLDLLQQAEDKGRSLSDAQRKELAQKVELYRQYSEQLAKAKLAQDLLEQRRYNSMSAADQQVYTTLKQYGLSTDLNSKEAGQIRQSQQLERQNEAIDQFAESLSNGIVNSGGDIGKAFGEVFLNELKDTAQKQLSNVLGQLFKALLTGGGNGSPIGSSATALGGGLLSSVLGGGSGKSAGGAVDLAGGLLGKSETANRGQINSFLKAGGVDLDAAQQAWCAGFVNSSLAQIGVKGSGSNIANSFQNWGSAIDPSSVMRGDVLLQARGLGAGQAGGHVGFATGQSRMTDGQLQLQMLSGNSGNAVSTTWVNAAEVQAKRATEAANALASVADSSKVATQGLGQLGRLSTSFFPSAPAASSGGGGFGSIFSSLFGGGLSAAQIAKYSPMVGLFADGGDVRGPGTGTSDSIPAMLSDGEFVVNAAATKKHRALLRAINGGRVGHFAAGGFVGGGIAAPVAPSLRSGRSAANNNAPGVMVIHLDGANGDDHVMALAKQAVTDGLGQYNKNQERGGFGTVQGQFTKRKG